MNTPRKIKRIYEEGTAPTYGRNGFDSAKRLESEVASALRFLQFDQVVTQYSLGNVMADIACFSNQKKLLVEVKTGGVRLSDLGQWIEYFPMCDRLLAIHGGSEEESPIKLINKYQYPIILLSYRDFEELLGYIGNDQKLRKFLTDFFFEKRGKADLREFKKYIADRRFVAFPERKSVALMDPVYGEIILSDVERRLVETAIMQRLRRIRQLGLAYLTYPSATHTRFQHSLGCLAMADKILRQLKLPKVSKEEIRLARLAALLHDIGHGPFSHVSEQMVCYCSNRDVSYKDITLDLLQTSEEIKAILGVACSDVEDILRSRFENNILNEVVHGPIDADRLDYIQRDSRFTDISQFSARGHDIIEPLLSHLTKIKIGNKSSIGVRDQGKKYLENLLRLEVTIYRTIYGNLKPRIADSMWISVLKWFLDEKIMDADIFKYRMLNRKFLEKYIQLDDYTLFDTVIRESKYLDPEMASHLKTGRTFVTAFDCPLEELGELYFRTKEGKTSEELLSKTIAERANLNRELVILDILGKHYSTFKLPEVLEGFERIDQVYPSLLTVGKLFVYSPGSLMKRVRDSTQETLKEL